MVKQLGFSVLIWLMAMSLSWANVESKVDRAEVVFGDSIQLTVTALDLANAPDLSPLDADFDIADRRQETQFSLINGNGAQRSTWILTLYPKRTGTLQIPALSFGAEFTQPITLKVNDAPDMGAPPKGQAQGTDPNTDISIEFELKPQNPLVQQQVILTQRLMTGFNLDAAQASLTLPQIESGKGLLRQLGNPVSRNIERNGKRYESIERRFALVPQQSGTIVIARTVFDGIMPDPNALTNDPTGRYFAWGSGGRAVRRFSKPFEISVAPKNPSFTGTHWLPARNISLNASWDKPLDKLKAGDPVTLTLAIIADGLVAEQLPALTVPVPVGVKVYADQPLLNDQVRDDGIIGIRQEKWVFVATGGGEFTIPEVTLDWWNTKTNQQETARVNAAAFKVGGEPLKAVTPPPAPVIEPPKDTATLQPKTLPELSKLNVPIWVWGVMLGFVVLVLSIIGYRYNNRKTQEVTEEGRLPSTTLAKGSLNHLLTACQKNDKQAAHQGLIAWARDVLGLPAPHWWSLRNIATPQLKDAMDQLDYALYGQDGTQKVWSGAALASAVKAMPKPAEQKRVHYALTPLYPSS